MSTIGRVYNCARCKGPVRRSVTSCKLCLKDFHPACAKSYYHKVYNSNNGLVRCTGLFKTIGIQNSKAFVARNDNSSTNSTTCDSLESTSTQNTMDDSFSRMDHRIKTLMDKIDEVNTNNITTMKQVIKKYITEQIKELKNDFHEKQKHDFAILSPELKQEFASLKGIITMNQTHAIMNNKQ